MVKLTSAEKRLIAEIGYAFLKREIDNKSVYVQKKTAIAKRMLEKGLIVEKSDYILTSEGEMKVTYLELCDELLIGFAKAIHNAYPKNAQEITNE